MLVVSVPLLIRLFLLVVGGVVHDVRDPGKEHVDELAVHQDLDRAVEHFAEDVLVELARADSCFTHQTYQRDQVIVRFFASTIFRGALICRSKALLKHSGAIGVRRVMLLRNVDWGEQA